MGKAERWTVVLPEEGSAEFEAVCEAVHNEWWNEKERQGVFDHPDMVPYAQLAEDKKDYDRATVRVVLEGLRTANQELAAQVEAGRIRPGDYVRHEPSGEKWVVCGVKCVHLET